MSKTTSVSSSTSSIDDLIAKHEEAIKRVEILKDIKKETQKGSSGNMLINLIKKNNLHITIFGLTGAVFILSMKILNQKKESERGTSAFENNKDESLLEENLRLKSEIGYLKKKIENICEVVNSGGWSMSSRLKEILRDFQSKSPSEKKDVKII